MVKVIALGRGSYVINHGHFANSPALFIEAVDRPGAVGADASDSGLDPNNITRGAVITFGNVESARALRDELTAAINLFNETTKG
jgi:hypothetical protein